MLVEMKLRCSKNNLVNIKQNSKHISLKPLKKSANFSNSYFAGCLKSYYNRQKNLTKCLRNLIV